MTSETDDLDWLKPHNRRNMTASERKQEKVLVRLSKKLEQVEFRLNRSELDREYWFEMLKSAYGLPCFELTE